MDAKLDLPTYDGRMNPDVAIDWVDALNSFFECDEILENLRAPPPSSVDWVDALNSFFECDEILENQRKNIAKSKLKGTTLTWWNITQGDRVKNGKGLVTM